MINEHGVEIADHLGIGDLNEIISECKTQIRFFKRLMFIKSLMQGSTIFEATEFVGYSERTGYNWLKSYNQKGLDGLVPNFGGGRPSFLTEEQLKELHEILKDKNSNFTIENTRMLIHEKFGIKYSYKQVWEITRKKLKLNYAKPSPKSQDRPKNRKELLKKKLKM
jgi:transposase